MIKPAAAVLIAASLTGCTPKQTETATPATAPAKTEGPEYIIAEEASYNHGTISVFSVTHATTGQTIKVLTRDSGGIVVLPDGF